MTKRFSKKPVKRGSRLKVMLDRGKVRAALAKKGWTFEDAASGSGVSIATFVRSHRGISIGKARQIAQRLGTTLDSLVLSPANTNSSVGALALDPDVREASGVPRSNSFRMALLSQSFSNGSEIFPLVARRMTALAEYIEERSYVRMLLSIVSISKACDELCREVAKELACENGFITPEKIGAFLCYFLYENKPIQGFEITEFGLSDQAGLALRHYFLEHGNEIVAIEIGCLMISTTVVRERLDALIEQLHRGVSLSDVVTSFRLLSV